MKTQRLHPGGRINWKAASRLLALSAVWFAMFSPAKAQNTLYGVGACPITAGQDNTCVGADAGYNTTTGSYNAFYGAYSGYSNTTGGQGPGPNNSNAFFGAFAGYSNTTASSNTFVGGFSGFSATGGNNTFVGNQAGYSTTTGDANVFAGSFAGQYNATGSSNIYIGYGAGMNNAAGSGNIYIGDVGPTSESATIRIGTAQTAAYMAGVYGETSSSGVEVFIDSTGHLGTKKSSLRYKEQVRDMGDRTSALMKLRPVTFFYKPDYAKGDRTLQYGLVAEEVAKVYPELVVYGSDGRPDSVRYEYIATMLLNEVQQQHRRAEAQAELIQAQQREIEGLRHELRTQTVALEQRLSRVEANTRLEVAAVR